MPIRFVLSTLIAIASVSTLGRSAQATPSNSKASGLENIAIAKRELYNIMIKATEYVSVEADRKIIQARQLVSIATVLDSAGLTGSQSESMNNDTSKQNVEHRKFENKSRSNRSSQSLDFSLNFSLATFFSFRDSSLQVDIAKAQLEAKRMSLAADAAQAYLTFVSQIGLWSSFTQSGDVVEKLIEKATNLGSTAKASLSNAVFGAFRAPAINSSLIGHKSLHQLQEYDPEFSSEIAEISKSSAKPKGNVNDSSGDYDNDPDKLIEYLEELHVAQLNSMFNIPDTAEEAFARSQKSVARIEPGIKEELAVNNWFLTLAQAGPRIGVNFTKYSGGFRQAGFGRPVSNEGVSSTVNVSFALSGGLPLYLASQSMLIDASELQTIDVDNQIRTRFRDKYAELEFFDAQHRLNIKNFRSLMTELNRIPYDKLTDNEAYQLSSLYPRLSIAVREISNDVDVILKKRIEILSLMGTLIETLSN